MLSMRCLAVLAVLVAVVAPAAPAAAASPGCYGDSCDGGYAANLGCVPGAYAIAGFLVANPNGLPSATGDLWYSPACHAAWGEYNTPSPTDTRGLYLYSQPFNGGSVEITEFTSSVDLGNNRTTMVSWDSSIKLCAHYGSDPNINTGVAGPDVGCTRWR